MQSQFVLVRYNIQCSNCCSGSEDSIPSKQSHSCQLCTLCIQSPAHSICNKLVNIGGACRFATLHTDRPGTAFEYNCRTLVHHVLVIYNKKFCSQSLEQLHYRLAHQVLIEKNVYLSVKKKL